MPSTVLIVDDHPLFRRGVAQLLAMDPEIEVIGEAAHGAAAVELARAKEPDLILLDLNLKSAAGSAEIGIDVLTALKDDDPARRVVMLTVSDAPDDLMHAIRAGADGYLLKDMEPEDLLARVREALTGTTVISDALAGRLAAALPAEAQDIGRKAERDLSSLTDREQAVLRCVAEGQSNKLTARTLNITEGTVKVHVKHLLKKLGFRSRVEAAVWATQLGRRDAGQR
ncbi:MAG: two-component system response regulator NarL [Burkholderiales bacterium]|jgi:two-component system nitrate/nitrite response regulator NarL|nr:two-component system response regulator NarL [Burkholderiales bacterium]